MIEFSSEIYKFYLLILCDASFVFLFQWCMTCSFTWINRHVARFLLHSLLHSFHSSSQLSFFFLFYTSSSPFFFPTMVADSSLSSSSIHANTTFFDANKVIKMTHSILISCILIRILHFFLITPLLNVDNYHFWSRSMTMALRSKNKLHFISGALPQPPDEVVTPLFGIGATQWSCHGWITQLNLRFHKVFYGWRQLQAYGRNWKTVFIMEMYSEFHKFMKKFAPLGKVIVLFLLFIQNWKYYGKNWTIFVQFLHLNVIFRVHPLTRSASIEIMIK